MPLYHMAFAFLIVGSVWEHVQKRTPQKLFLCAYFILAAMLCLRFGQGQDYFSYASIYYSLPQNIVDAIQSDIHSEPGWKMLCILFRAMGVQFPVMVFALSAYISVTFFRFLKLYGGQRKFLILVMCYHTLYMSYFVSSMRQAVLIATFLGILLPWLQNRNYIKFCFGTFVLVTIHSVSVILLILPLICQVEMKFKHLVAFVSFGFLAGILLTAIDIASVLQKFLPIVYLGETQISVIAIAERIASFTVVTFCYYLYLDGMEPDPDDPLMIIYKIYALGVCLYGLLLWSALISSRTVYVLKTVEVILIGESIGKCKKSGVVVLIYCLLLSMVMYVKNVDSYLEQGQYQNATVASYPFVSVFNQKDILNYRQETHGYPFQ